MGRWCRSYYNLTLDDLCLMEPGIIWRQSAKKSKPECHAITPVVLKNGEKASMNYGYGLAMSKFRGEDIISHSGGLHGFVTQLSYYPKEKLTVVMFSNTAEPEVNFDPNKIAEAFLWNKMDKQTSYAESM